MKHASVTPHSPAQKLVDFFKKTSDSDLILAYEDKTTGQTILYSKKSDLLHSLRKFFFSDYAEKVQMRQKLARFIITTHIDQGRHGDDLSNQSVTRIKNILESSPGEIKANELKDLFAALNPARPRHKALEKYANEAWDVSSRELAALSEFKKNEWQIPHILQAVGNLSVADTDKLKALLACGKPLSQEKAKELDAQIDALKKFMKQKGATELNQIDYESIFSLWVAWKRANPAPEYIDTIFSEKTPLATACLYLSNFGKTSAEDSKISIVSGSLGLYPSDVIVVAGGLNKDDAGDLAQPEEKSLIHELPDSKKDIGKPDIIAVQIRRNKSTDSSTLIKLPRPQADGEAFPMQQLRRSYKEIRDLISNWKELEQADTARQKRSPTRSLLISPISVDGSESKDKMLKVFADEVLTMREAIPRLKIIVRDTPDFSREAISEALRAAVTRKAGAARENNN